MISSDLDISVHFSGTVLSKGIRMENKALFFFLLWF